jgi:RimJ/RimL family protein N-acetyltransferase
MPTDQTTALTEFEPDDMKLLFQWINTPELVRFNAAYRPVQPGPHADWFAALGRDHSRVTFAIRAMPGRRLVGMVQLVDIDPVHRSAEAQIRIGAVAEQGQGRGSWALRQIVDFAWRDLNLHRVTAHAFATNGRAVAAYKKAGFELEGQMREAAHIDGKWTDIVVLGVLRPGDR